MSNRIAILGSGALGIALATNFSRHKNIDKILLYSRREEIANEINNKKICLFEGIQLSDKIKCTNELNEVENHDIIFITVNSTGFLDIIRKLSKISFKIQPLVIICVKSIGINGEFLSEIARKNLQNDKIALLYGPSFAHEIAHGEKTFVNFVYHDDNTNYIDTLVDENTNLKMIQINDYIGAQLCSIMKNICAIYMGILKGSGSKNDFLAATFKFFIDEITKTIKIHGGSEKTIFDLCGIGDLFLTCTSFESRNYTFGHDIGKEENIQFTIEKYKDHYPEGYYALPNLLKLNERKKFQSKFCEKLSQFLNQKDKFNINLLKDFS